MENIVIRSDTNFWSSCSSSAAAIKEMRDQSKTNNKLLYQFYFSLLRSHRMISIRFYMLQKYGTKTCSHEKNIQCKNLF